MKITNQLILIFLVAIWSIQSEVLRAQDASPIETPEAASADPASSLGEFSVLSLFSAGEDYAVGVAAEYLNAFNEANAETLIVTGSGFVDFGPEISIKQGGEDAFDGILATVEGHYANLSVPDDLTQAEALTMHVFPFATGVETNRDFSNSNWIAEVGYAPWHLPKGYHRYKLGKNPAVGLFFQGGYKFADDRSDTDGGDANDGAEREDDFLARIKLDVRADIFLADLGALRKGAELSVIPRVRVWYDLANSEVYYNAAAIARLRLSESKSFDFVYEKGSGAPNFNEGDQFSAGLTIHF